MRKPRGIKLNGHRSMDMCPGCYAFNCDSMAMSQRFQDKIRKRMKLGLCPACGAKPVQKNGTNICKCKGKRGLR